MIPLFALCDKRKSSELNVRPVIPTVGNKNEFSLPKRTTKKGFKGTRFWGNERRDISGLNNMLPNEVGWLGGIADEL